MLDLGLDKDEALPRRLLRFPDGSTIAYGGDDGTLVRVQSDGQSVQEVRFFDEDSLRTIAVSENGQRVVVGLDSGALAVYIYDMADGDPHPFSAAGASTRETRPGERVYPGPAQAAPIRDVHFLTSTIAIVCSEAGLSCMDVSSTERATNLPDWDAAVVSDAHDESGIRGVCRNANQKNWLTTLGMDGRACHWDVSEPTHWNLATREECKAVTKQDVGEILGADAWDRSTRPAAIGEWMALPGEPHWQLRSWVVEDDNTSVQPVEVATEAASGESDNAPSGHVQAMVCIAARDDEIVATAGRDARVLLWKIEKTGKLRATAHLLETLWSDAEAPNDSAAAPTDLQWQSTNNKKNNELWVTTASGKLVVCHPKTDLMAATKTSTATTTKESVATETSSTTLADDDNDDDDQEKQRENKPKEQEVETMNSDDGDDDDDDDVGKAKRPEHPLDSADSGDDDEDTGSPRREPKSSNKFIDDEADHDEDADNDNDKEGKAICDPLTDDDDDNDSVGSNGSMDDDDAGASSNFLKDSSLGLGGYGHHHLSLPPPKIPQAQPPFMPSSTPLDRARRFLCWNHVGSIIRTSQDLDTIDVHFTDAAFRRPIAFTDNLGFIVGSLGPDGAILATDVQRGSLDDDDDDDDLRGVQISDTTKASLRKNKTTSEGSTLYFHRYETFGALRDKDWYSTLPDGEGALGCAAGAGWAAVVTSRRFLRFYSSGGNQSGVHWLPGPPVTMAGRGRLLAVVTHKATLPDDTQQLNYALWDAVNQTLVARGEMSCISPKASLQWLGFDNDGSLVAMDSDGMVSLLGCCSANAAANEDPGVDEWSWMPMLDTVGLRKSSEDAHWPITVHDGKLACVLLKGGLKHPDAARRPVTMSLSFRLPLAQGSLVQTQALEELSVRANLALMQKQVLQELAQDDPDDEKDFEKEYRALSAQVDKVTLKMFAATVDAGKVERALDLVDRLHLEKSFLLAMKIADHHRKLVDLIQDCMDRKFGAEDDEEEEDDDQWSTASTTRPPLMSQRVSPDSASHSKRLIDYDDDASENRMVRRRVK